MEEKKYYTYVILTKKNTLYCGYTDDVEKRFKAHVASKGAKYTRAFKPEKIVYVKEFETKLEAQNHERFFKTLKKDEKLSLIKDNALKNKYKNLQKLTK